MTTAVIHMQTMAKTYEEIQSRVAGYPWVPLGNLMMDFYRNFPEHRAELINEPIRERPQEPGAGQSEADDEEDMHRWAVFCAASAEYLAHRYGLEVPAWVHDPIYSPLPEPWYFAPMALKKPRVRERIERQTPEEFARRNIFCGDRVWVDKYEEAQEFQARQTA